MVPSVDHELRVRVERAMGRLVGARCEALARVAPHTGATRRPFGGGWLVASGHGRQVNRAVGIADDDLGAAQVEELEEFFDERGLPPSIEIPSWAAGRLVVLLGRRGYTPVEFTNVYVRRPGRAPRLPRRISLAEVGRADDALWRRVVASAHEPDDDTSRQAGEEHARAMAALDDAVGLIARVDGQVAGYGSVQYDGSIAWLSGSATLPAFRDRGVQSTLVAHRLGLAAMRGCEWVTASATPDTPSARNLERFDFRLAYTRLVLTRGGNVDRGRVRGRAEAEEWLDPV